MDSYATFRLLVRHESPKSPASRGAFLFYPPTCRPMMALRIECRVRCTYQIWGWQDRHFSRTNRRLHDRLVHLGGTCRSSPTDNHCLNKV